MGVSPVIFALHGRDARGSRHFHGIERSELSPPASIVKTRPFSGFSFPIYEGVKAESVELRFKDWASRVASERIWHPSQKTRRHAEGRLEMTLKVAVTPKLEHWLWSWGDTVEVIKPITLRKIVRTTYQRAATING
jgi:hypothetical protein